MKKYRIEYSSNNNGGSWWLEDKDWHSLEEAGWKVAWHRKKRGSISPGERFLGALATGASIEIKAEDARQAMGQAIRHFEEVTKKDASEEGCNCCGPPHGFTVERSGCKKGEDKEWQYASGEEVCGFLYETVPGSYREAVELLNASRATRKTSRRTKR